MDGAGFLAVLALLILLSGPFMLMALLYKVASLRDEIRSLAGKLDALTNKKVLSEKKPASKLQPPTKTVVAEHRCDACRTDSVVRSSAIQAVASQRHQQEPSAIDVFQEACADWLLARGKFSVKGMTREFSFATRWLVRIGVLLVAASIAYFVKLSVDRGWMGPAGRVVSTVFWGLVASISGIWTAKRTRYGVIGQALVALGIVALYFGFGLGHRFFDPPVIASAQIAFVALFGVTLFAGFLAVTIPSSFVAVMAILGGYAVPFIAGRESGSPVALCFYLLVINAMAFFVSRFRRWSALDFLSSAICYAAMFAWCSRHPDPVLSSHLAVFAFFTVAHALYAAGVVVDSGLRGNVGNAIAWSGLALNACAYAAFLATIFRSGFSDLSTGFVYLSFVVVYFAVVLALKRMKRTDVSTVNILLIFAMAYLSIAPILLFGKDWWIVAWCAIAVAASEAEKLMRQRILGIVSLVILSLSAIAGICYFVPVSYDIAFSYGAGTLAVEATAGYWLSLFSRAVRLWSLPVAVMFVARRSHRWLIVVAGIMAFAFYTLESMLFGKIFLPSFGGGAVTLAWMILSFACVWFGIVRRIGSLRVSALVLIGGSVVKLLFSDTAHLATPARAIVFAVTGFLLIMGAFLYIKFREKFTENQPRA